MKDITVNIDKNRYLLNTKYGPQHDTAYDGDFEYRDTYTALFSDGSHCSCYIGEIGSPEYDEETKDFSLLYGIQFYSDENSNMSDEALELCNELSADTCKYVNIPAVNDEDHDILEPDYDKRDEIAPSIINGIEYKFKKITHKQYKETIGLRFFRSKNKKWEEY